MHGEKTLDISWAAILKISSLVLFFYVFYQIRNVLVWFLFAVVISILFNPAIDFLRRFKIPRVLAVCFVYIVFFGALVLIIYAAIPLFTSEIAHFSQIIPQYFEKISPPLRGLGMRTFTDIETFLSTLGAALDKMAANIANILFFVFGGIAAAVLVLTLSIYLSMDEGGIKKALTLLFPTKYEASVLALWERCQKKVSGWFIIRIIACLFVAVFSCLALLLFNTSYPFSLGLLAGALNFIPIAGPFLTAILLFVVVSLDSLSKAIFVLIVFTLIQQVENEILTPLISKKFVGLPPALVLMSLAIGGILWGFLGAILSIPLGGILFEFLKEFLEKRRAEG